MFETGGTGIGVLDMPSLNFFDFKFVSNFVLRISDLLFSEELVTKLFR